MKKFLYLIEVDLTSGASLCAAELISQLNGTDFQPIVITQHKNDINDACDQFGVENYHFHYARICSLGMGFIGWLIAFFSHPFLNLLALKYLEKEIDFNSISFIHLNDSSIDFGAYLYKKKNIPHIWHVRVLFFLTELDLPFIWRIIGLKFNFYSKFKKIYRKEKYIS